MTHDMYSFSFLWCLHEVNKKNFLHFAEPCVVHAFTSKHREAVSDPGNPGHGTAAAAVEEWVVVGAGEEEEAPDGRLIRMTAATSAGKEVTTPTTAPGGAAVEEGVVAGAGRFRVV